LYQKLISVFLFQKSLKFNFFIKFCPGKNFLVTLGPKASDKKIQKMAIFKVNPRLVKSSYCPKLILTYNIWTSICKKMSKSVKIHSKICQNPLLVFVSLKYCAEKRLLKTHVAFFKTVLYFQKVEIWD
jgi:hypothetical protein